MSTIGRAVWGIDASVPCMSMKPVADADGITVIDVPCGGGVALRALRPDRDVRYIAADICPKMLARTEQRAKSRSLRQVECVHADILQVPFAENTADLLACFSGPHMVAEPERAIGELARCLRPGGRLIGTTFVAEMRPRGRRMFAAGARRGHAFPPRRDQLHGWMSAAGLRDIEIGGQLGLVTFDASEAVA